MERLIFVYVVLLLTAVFGMPGCSSSRVNERGFAREPAHDRFEIEKGLTQIEAQIIDPQVFNPSTCSAFLGRVTSYLIDKGESRFIESSESAYSLFEPRAVDVLHRLFRVRMLLRDRLIALSREAQGGLSPECVNAMRRALRYVRYGEESLSEWYLNRQPSAISAVREDFGASNELQLLISPKYRRVYGQKPWNVMLESGDILVVRDDSFVSAAIARVGDEDGQFSHLAMVYEYDGPEPRFGNRKFVIEALIKSGLIITPLEDWVKHGHARAALFRYNGADAEIPRRAARTLFAKVSHLLDSETLSRGGAYRRMRRLADPRHVEYNFGMDLRIEDRVFCSQIARIGFREASAGQLVLPTHPTSLREVLDTAFLKAMAITTQETFSPNDMEVEPQFDQVAEWRDLTKIDIRGKPKFRTQMVKLDDAVWSSLFSWMAEARYAVIPSTLDKISGAALNGIPNGLLAIGFRLESFPVKAPRDFAMQTLTVRSFFPVIQNEVYAADDAYFLASGYSLPFNSARGVVERFRRKDCIVSLLRKRRISTVDGRPIGDVKFHHLFNVDASKSSCLDPDRPEAAIRTPELIEAIRGFRGS